MAEEQVLTNGVECKRCANRESNREARRKCDQEDLDKLLEITQRLKFIARTMWEMKEFDQVELGTVSLMIGREADDVFEILGSLETRLGE
jgi:hypothetical protein